MSATNDHARGSVAAALVAAVLPPLVFVAVVGLLGEPIVHFVRDTSRTERVLLALFALNSLVGALLAYRSPRLGVALLAAMFIAPLLFAALGEIAFSLELTRMLPALEGADPAARGMMASAVTSEALVGHVLGQAASAASCVAVTLICAMRSAAEMRLGRRDEALLSRALAVVTASFAVLAFAAVYAAQMQRAPMRALLGAAYDRHESIVSQAGPAIASAVRARSVIQGVVLLILFLASVWTVRRKANVAAGRVLGVALLVELGSIGAWTALAASTESRIEHRLAGMFRPAPGARIASLVDSRTAEDDGYDTTLVRGAILFRDGARVPLTPASANAVVARLHRVVRREESWEPLPEDDETLFPFPIGHSPVALPRVNVLLDEGATRRDVHALLIGASDSELARLCLIGESRSRRWRTLVDRYRDVELFAPLAAPKAASVCVALRASVREDLRYPAGVPMDADELVARSRQDAIQDLPWREHPPAFDFRDAGDVSSLLEALRELENRWTFFAAPP